MSNFRKIALGKTVTSLDVSPRFGAYSGVEIIIDDKTSAVWPESESERTSGRVLTLENPWGTQEQARNILASLQSTGFRYQPYKASGALLDPAAEIGDGATINGVYSGIYKLTRGFGPLMVSDIEAPQDEEVDHEYPYEPKQDRVYKREIGEAKSQISVTTEAITSLVSRVDEAESSVTTLEQTANTLSANAMRKTGGSSSTFGWTLTDTDWTLKSNGNTVFKATSSGVEITGKITATEGYIGSASQGFEIGSKYIRNGLTGVEDESHKGVYIGTDGFAIRGSGGSVKIDTRGYLFAREATLLGRLWFWDAELNRYVWMDANTLRSGAQSAVSNGGYWSGGGVAGTKFDKMKQTEGYPLWATSFRVDAGSRKGVQFTVRTIYYKDHAGNNRSAEILASAIN